TARGDPEAFDQLQTVAARDDLTARLNEEFDREILDEAMTRVRQRVSAIKWEVFRLTAIEGLSAADVGARLNIKVPTVYAVRSKIQKMLREELQKLDEPALPDAKELP